MAKDTTIRLGEEYDDALVQAAKAALRRCGAEPMRATWAVGGSQEVSEQGWTTAEGVLTLRAETFEGLTLTGPAAVVEEVASLVRAAGK